MFAVLRDILFVYGQIHNTVRFPNLNLDNSVHITNLVFSILRNARALHVGEAPNMVVCWGGHSINENEYLYARRVGNQLGLRELNILHRLWSGSDGSADERCCGRTRAAALQRQSFLLV
ncbi:putative decarboxylase [Escherichia coli]|uniref:Putative decarboxylase n=1 Tax=Escherichia coli TaxID=562 RepID=A0A376KMN7_ECOLX|nr:putative decarboxylase [Escherichia coli]